MWWGENILWIEYLLAVIRRIFVGLEEGDSKTANKCGSKVRVTRHLKKLFQEREAGCFHGREHAHPLLPLSPEEVKPMVELFLCDKETLTEPLHRSRTQEILRQDPEDEKEAIGRVGDDEVREDGMGMAAGTGKAQDAEAVADRVSMNKVDKRAAIVGMDSAGAFRPTAGAGLGFRAEAGHEGIKKVFR